MERRKTFILTLIIVSVVMLSPFLLSLLMEKEWLRFVSGQTDSWIGFWGSYIGAIIGAIAIFIVARIEIKARHDQQNKDINRENDILYKRAMEGYLIRNKIEKIDEMIYVADELYSTVKRQEKEMIKMVKMRFEDDAKILQLSEEEKEFQYDTIYTNVTTCTNQNMSYYKKLLTLCSYVPEAEDELYNIGELLTALDQYVIKIFNNEKGYLEFCEFDDEHSRVGFVLPIMGEIHRQLPEFIVYHLKDNLSEHLKEVRLIAGEWMELE